MMPIMAKRPCLLNNAITAESSFHMSEIIPTYHGHTPEGLEEFFADTNSAYFIHRSVVVDKDNQIDLAATAINFDATVTIEDVGARFGFLVEENGKYKICITPGLDEASQQFVFGHEIAHIVIFDHLANLGKSALTEFYKRTNCEPAYHEFVEAFCDYFAGRILDSVCPSEVPVRKRPTINTKDVQLLLY